MKIWYGYGSEHSMNLVMIGHFRDAKSAAEAKDLIEKLTEHVLAEAAAGTLDIGRHQDRFSDKLRDLLDETKIYTMGPSELEQLGYDARVKLEDDRIAITTDEADVSAFLKLLIDRGARVEVYSAHEYPDTAYGRGK
jgi:hypothetical protein